jgi:outer membrane receptor protein involved in Fe transport
VLPQGAIERLPGVNLDDRLRNIPGFTLFRRTSSVVANPTTQGVSLRGVGSNGASRTLVLWDAVPINDPFGSWVYWTRIPPDQIDRIEVMRGASTSVFGDMAMGGTISIFSRPPEPWRGSLSYEGGNRGTNEVDGSVSNVWRRFAASAEIRAFSTDGYFIVPESIRGKVDAPASVEFVAGNTFLDFFGGGKNRLSVKLDILAEDRANGTVLTHNSTSLGTLSADYSWQQGANAVSALFYRTQEEFRATFSAVSNNRNTERLTSVQSVLANGTGGAAFATHNWVQGSVLAGGDLDRVEGFSTDHLVPTGVRVGGGTLFHRAGFAQANLKTGPLNWYAGARESWTGQGDTFFSPNGGVAAGYKRLRIRGSVYRSFRAPTLNELYRQFRVGNTVTLANSDLRPEKLFGAEAGLDLSSENSRFSVTFFRNDLNGLITNVTLSSGSTIIRQRQNAEGALSRGGEATFNYRWRRWNFDAAYLYADPRTDSGLLLPQTPKHSGSSHLTWSRAGTLISAGLFSYSLQFEDDLNQFLLPGFASVELYGRQQIGHGISATLSIENVLDKTYLVGFTPQPMIGPPLLWRAGLRWESR